MDTLELRVYFDSFSIYLPIRLDSNDYKFMCANNFKMDWLWSIYNNAEEVSHKQGNAKTNQA